MLTQFQVFNDWAYSSYTETLRQQVALFNQASGGAFVLTTAANNGDFSETAFYKEIANLVRRRNPRGTATPTEQTLSMGDLVTVKVGGGAGPVRIDPSMFAWIQRDPEEGGTVYGRQLAVASLTDMVNLAVGAVIAALDAQALVKTTDLTAATKMQQLNTARSKFGDAAGGINVWAMHSKTIFDMFGENIANANSLFSFGTVNVRDDGFGNRFVVTDSPYFIKDVDPNPDHYYVLGLTAGAVRMEDNGDFFQNVDTINGGENIKRTVQSEWSWNIGVKGFAWDKTNGGAAPANAALVTSTNWDKVVTSHKDLAGVILETL